VRGENRGGGGKLKTKRDRKIDCADRGTAGKKPWGDISPIARRSGLRMKREVEASKSIFYGRGCVLDVVKKGGEEQTAKQLATRAGKLDLGQDEQKRPSG